MNSHTSCSVTVEAEAGLSDSDLTPRSLREVEAEAVALLCIESLRLPGAEFSRGYLQAWNARRGAEPIPERSAQRIFKAGRSNPEGWHGGRGDRIMTARKAVVWRQVVDELANALQVAIGFAAQVRRNAQTTADDAVLLEGAIAKAVSLLAQAQPRASRKKGRR